MNEQDFYAILGLTKSASPDEIKKAYKKKAICLHPDKAPQNEKDLATAKFQELMKAYEILSDSKKRAEYDRQQQYKDSRGVREYGQDGSTSLDNQFKSGSMFDSMSFDYWSVLFSKFQEIQKKSKDKKSEAETKVRGNFSW